MPNIKQNRIEIRGLSDNEINYLKALAKTQKEKSFNDFLLKMCREKIEKGQFNQAENLYLAHLENMKETSDFMLAQSQKTMEQLENFDEKIKAYAEHISRWLEYEGEVESED
ncbi:TPA: hypothetical protein VJE30_001327 [Streptococcus pyogenes]|nr:hypothetical protein [Streptococcus pyogenes]